jgi:hypothetical protein
MTGFRESFFIVFVANRCQMLAHVGISLCFFTPAQLGSNQKKYPTSTKLGICLSG